MAELTKETVTKKLNEKFGDVILKVEEPYNFPTYTVKRDYIVDILKFLYNDPELQFQFLTDITGIHYTNPEEQLGAIYHLHNLFTNTRIRLKAFFPKEDPYIDSATSVFAAANWMERETYDFYGIIFKGHPDLKRILNVDNMDYFPLRKEYRLEDATRTDKDDAMFGR